ncbi:MAG: prolyl oligopeptidase family serine peptidase, partial [Desulfobacteraceae bacterium]
VLQPNFRGSTGFGSAFRQAGHGRWGREMQNDVSDGITTLVKASECIKHSRKPASR